MAVRFRPVPRAGDATADSAAALAAADSDDGEGAGARPAEPRAAGRLGAGGCCRRRRYGAGAAGVRPWLAEAQAVRNASDIDEAWLGRFPLSTTGRDVVDRHGERFKLAGVNWYGASDAYHVVGGLDTQALPRICAAVRELGFSVVRMPFSNEMLRAPAPVPGSIDFELNPGLVGKAPLEVMDEVVRELGRHRIAVILNNHTTFATWCGGPDENGLWFVADRDPPWGRQTEEQWIEDWVMLASRYAGCPQVVGYDLRNEVRAAPGRLGPESSFPWLRWPVARTSAGGGAGGGEGACPPPVLADWVAAAARCAERLQAVNSGPLLIVERIVWPQRSLAPYVAHPGPLLPRFAGKLVLAVHSYGWTAPGLYIVKWMVPGMLHPVLAVLGALGLLSWRNHTDAVLSGGVEELKRLARKEWGWVLEEKCCPVWVSEFGGSLSSREDMVWLEAFVCVLHEYDADWAYWPLNVGPKPASGENEAYGMLTGKWEPPPDGSDRRLALLRSIMLPTEKAAAKSGGGGGQK